jgi:hypothetical protein
MDSCAFVMLIAGLRVICRRAYVPPGVLGLSVPAVPVAAFLVRPFPLGAVRVLVLVVAVYTALAMPRGAANDARLAPVVPALPTRSVKAPDGGAASIIRGNLALRWGSRARSGLPRDALHRYREDGRNCMRAPTPVRRRRRGVLIWTPLAVLLGLTPTLAPAAVPSPTLEGPITSPGSAFISSTSFDLSEVGYTQQEYFFSGTATAYTSASPLTPDGKWTVTPGSTAPYKTRLLVYRPANPKKFNGTVVVEWLNVSGGLDAAPDWTQAHTELIREGVAWVGVSAQFVGVEGGPGLVGVVSLPLKTVNPARYGSLSHPGDSFSYDIFSQAGQAIRQPAGISPLGDLKVRRVIAAGESQSAFRLVTYIDGIHPVAGIYQGFLVHSRGGGGAFGAALSEAPQPAVGIPFPTFIRDDVDVPVLTVETETDLTFLQYFPARQDDGPHVRLWEMAGTSHADTYTITGMSDLGRSPEIVALLLTASPIPGIVTCDTPINSGPQHFIVNAAFAALNRWVTRGKAPRPAPRLDVSAGPPITIARDASGNAIGGIRTPQVDVPIATFTGLQSGSILCGLFGTTTPFDAAKLASLYPTHRAFVFSYKKSVNRAVKSGVILKPDARLMKQWAAGSNIGG